MQIFVLGLPHTQTTTEFTTCAFTMKVWNLCRMMTERGHQVIHLGTEGSNPLCSENVAVTPEAEWRELYGKPGTGFYHFETGGKYAGYTNTYVHNVQREIWARVKGPHSAIICCPWGGPQQNAVQAMDQYVVESGIGYPHTWARWRVFESYAWMHFHLGREGKEGGDAWYDVVIPNAFDLQMFDYCDRKEDYFLYFGRLIESKGVQIAVDVCKKIGAKLKIVGQGDPAPYLKDNPHVEYHPPVGIEGRRVLMSKAKALFVPTRYVEPFGGVAIEAMLSGTPVITTDWGVFTETVPSGYVGYRCRMFEQFEWAARHIGNIQPSDCRQWALNFSLEKVGRMYEEYFQSLIDLNLSAGLSTHSASSAALRGDSVKGMGWYTPNPSRKDLGFFERKLPR